MVNPSMTSRACPANPSPGCLADPARSPPCIGSSSRSRSSARSSMPPGGGRSSGGRARPPRQWAPRSASPPRPPHRAGLPAGVARGATLGLGATALAELRGRPSAVLSAFPLGDDGTADLELTRFEPFSPAARVEVVGRDGVHTLPLPDQVY